jgi:hypothetical protein
MPKNSGVNNLDTPITPIMTNGLSTDLNSSGSWGSSRTIWRVPNCGSQFIGIVSKGEAVNGPLTATEEHQEVFQKDGMVKVRLTLKEAQWIPAGT